jgi:hypothetical protein
MLVAVVKGGELASVTGQSIFGHRDSPGMPIRVVSSRPDCSLMLIKNDLLLPTFALD